MRPSGLSWAEALRGVVDDGLALHAGFTAVGATAQGVRGRPGLRDRPGLPQRARPRSWPEAGAAGGEQDFDGLIRHAAEHGTGVIAIRVYAAGALSAGPERHPTAWLPSKPLIPGSDYEADFERARRLERTAHELEMESVLEMGPRFALGAPASPPWGYPASTSSTAALRWAERGRRRRRRSSGWWDGAGLDTAVYPPPIPVTPWAHDEPGGPGWRTSSRARRSRSSPLTAWSRWSWSSRGGRGGRHAGAQTELLSIAEGEIQAMEGDIKPSRRFKVDRVVATPPWTTTTASSCPAGRSAPDKLRMDGGAIRFLQDFPGRASR